MRWEMVLQPSLENTVCHNWCLPEPRKGRGNRILKGISGDSTKNIWEWMF